MKPHLILLFFASLRNIPGELVLVLFNTKQGWNLSMQLKNQPHVCVTFPSLPKTAQEFGSPLEVILK